MRTKRDNQQWILDYGHLQRKVGIFFMAKIINKEQFDRYTIRLVKALLNKKF